ncbi:MAG TPA: polysaccharide deacetylase family protein [Solirubrobacteraceae bacterium]|jgi:peptidoglycan/xylan/chitin deacetylase (PgdA/CDA1 family)
MTQRWNWDFEDERKARSVAPQPAPAPTPVAAPVAGAEARRIKIRRRRGGAAIVLLILVVLIAIALLGSHHGRAPSATARGGAARVVHRPPASESENELRKAVSSVLAYTPFVREGAGRGRDIALTFDDGPGPYTPKVLDVLEREHVHATFFVVGKMLEYFSASAVREIEDGDVIGDHTQSHPELAKLSAHDQHEELFEQIARVEVLGGHRPGLFRPPYGSFDTTTLRQLKSLHLLMVLWSVDTGDYAQPGVATIVKRALAGAHGGAIILMHDAGGGRTETIEALPIIIAKLRAKGFRLVTVPQLLRDDPPPAGQQIPPNLSGG